MARCTRPSGWWQSQRRVLASDLLDGVFIFPDHLAIKDSGVPRMNLTLQEVGLTGGSSFQRVGEPTVDELDPGWRIGPWPPSLARREPWGDESGQG